MSGSVAGRFVPLIFAVLFALLLSSCAVKTGGGAGSSEITSETPESTAEPTRDHPDGYRTVGGIPTMYITMKNGYPLDDVTKDEYVDAECTLIGNTVDEDIVSAKLKLKGRGNYSWGLEKKPYTLKFSDKQDVLGMGSAKKWVLIANYSDKSHLRNYLTLNLGRAMGMEYTPECRYVNLVVDGEYRGLYLITEKIEIKKNRVDIDPEKGGVLLEIDPAYRHDNQCEYCVEVKPGLHFLIHDPEADDYGSEFMDGVKERVRTLLVNIEGSLRKGIDVYSEYIDVDSFVDWYILNEFVKNHDSAMYTSCYCWIGENGKLYMGPIWDYDTCIGNQDIENCMDPTGYYLRSHAQASWFVYLTRDADFEAKVKARWSELRENGVITGMINSIGDTVEYISASEKLDVGRWPGALKRTDLRGAHSVYTFEDEVSYMQVWLKTRYGWLNGKWSRQ